jgi:hypothetical protein
MTSADKVFEDRGTAQLAEAAKDGNLERIGALLNAGANIKAVGKQGMTVTQFALLARKNSPQVMAAVLRAGSDPVSMLSDGNSVPQYAVSRDNADPEVVRVLLEHGIPPNWFPPTGPYRERSLLQSAVMGHNLPVMKLLIERGADLNYVNPFDGSALHYALSGTDFFMAAYLVEAGIDLNLRDHTSPEIKNPRIIARTAIEQFCKFEGGKRGAHPLPRIAEGWQAFTAALAKRGVAMPCGL